MSSDIDVVVERVSDERLSREVRAVLEAYPVVSRATLYYILRSMGYNITIGRLSRLLRDMEKRGEVEILYIDRSMLFRLRR